jgi:hypothetical protein
MPRAIRGTHWPPAVLRAIYFPDAKLSTEHSMTG